MKKDWCTLFPDKIFGRDISKCCKAHDESYLVPGIHNKIIGDFKLWLCVVKGYNPLMWIVGTLMFIGVSIFGGIFWLSAQIKRLYNS